MRILIANEALSGGGGVETYLATLVPALQAAGHEVGVLHDNPASERGPQRIAPDATWRAGVRDEGLDVAIARVRRFAPDVCFSHNMRALAIDARLLAEWPVVKMMHGHFGTCVSGQKAFAFPGVTACTRSFGPGCLAYYLPRRCGQANPFVMMRQYAWGSEQRSLFDRYRAIVVASRFMREEYLAAGVAPGSVHAIPLFAPPHVAGAMSDEGPRPIDVLFLGRMTPLKGPDVLVDAAGRASARLGRRLSVVFAGEGPERERLGALAASRGIDARFPGWVGPAERDRLLRDAAIIAVPSRWPEPFGLVGLEGGVFGTPAVAFDAGGIAEWLTDGENGRLIAPARGAAGFGDAIADVLENPALRRRLAAGARAAAARLSLDSHVRLLMTVLGRARAAASAAAI
ncbi:MAG TPA: glycosyltransferase family 4 protein [Vicinamibacterales bacterium]